MANIPASAPVLTNVTKNDDPTYWHVPLHNTTNDEVTALAAQLGTTAAPGAALTHRTYEMTFTETAGNGTYTGTLACPAGSTVLDVILRNTALWTAGTSASVTVGDDDDPDGYIEATDLKAAPLADVNGAAKGLSTRLSLGATAGAYKGGGGKYCAAAKTLTVTITKVGSGTAGRTRVLVELAVPLSSAVAKV